MSPQSVRFSGDTCWDQHRQVFDAIVKSNGWDDDTAALQLLAHLEGDALSVALLVPEKQRATRSGLVGALIHKNTGMLFVWPTGPRSESVSSKRSNLPLLVTRMVGGKQGGQYMEVSPKTTPGRLQSGNDD